MYVEKIFVAILIFFGSMQALAHETISGQSQCQNERSIYKTYNATDSFVLLERIQYIGNTSDFVSADWQAFVSILQAFKIDMSELEVTIERQCDIFKARALVDENIQQFKSKGYKVFHLTISGGSTQAVEDSGKVGSHTRANSFRTVTLKGELITTNDCKDVVRCGPKILSFRVFDIFTTRITDHLVGGMSTAGGGGKPQTKIIIDPNDITIDYNKLNLILPGFGAQFSNQMGQLDYLSNIINVPKPNPLGTYLFNNE